MKYGKVTGCCLEGQENCAMMETSDGEGTQCAWVDGMYVHRVPTDVKTASFAPSTDDTWEDYDLVTALNAVLTDDIPLNEAVRLFGTLEVINGEAAVNNVIYGDGGTTSEALCTNGVFSTASAIGSEYIRRMSLITDGSGNIKIASDDVANVSLKFHLISWEIVRYDASA